MTLVQTTSDTNLAREIDRLRTSCRILEKINDLPRIVEAVETVKATEAFDLLAPLARDDSDGLLSRIAVFALSRVASVEADELLTQVLHRGDDLAGHAAWALSTRKPYVRALDPLVELTRKGGFIQMMAELALEAWMREIPEIAWRPEMDDASSRLGRSFETVQPRRRRGPGLRIAQIVMQGRVDAALTSAAKGDGGGLITLQVGLAGELARHPSVAEVFMVTRMINGESESLRRPFEPMGHKGTLARLQFGPAGYVPASDMWAHRADLERELRRFLQFHGPFDALHLRFLDVGTFAAARVARELGIPVYFTLAPDPHSLISAWEDSGVLTRENFAEFDDEQHFFFRAWLLQQLLEDAERLALLPRRGQREEFQDLLALDIDDDPERFVAIPEGVDFTRASNAGRVADSLAGGGPVPDAIRELQSRVRGLPAHRRGLPLILSVGRMHPVKGFDRLVAAWAGDVRLRDGFNLVIVGGDLETPSSFESKALSAIEDSRRGDVTGEDGLVLLGSRSHADVSLLMAAARAGVGDLIGPNGIYVAASEKEEFGLAIVEAMAAGLPVVAPVVGGPGLYVDHEVTGFLADTTNVTKLAEGIHWADAHRSSEIRALLAKRLVKSAYSLSAMADGLVALYSPDATSSVAS